MKKVAAEAAFVPAALLLLALFLLMYVFGSISCRRHHVFYEASRATAEVDASSLSTEKWKQISEYLSSPFETETIVEDRPFKVRKVTYAKVNVGPDGRTPWGRYETTCKTLQKIEKTCRSQLHGRRYVEIDMKCSGPCIVLQMAQKENLDLPHVEYYVRNHKSVLESISRKLQVSEKKAKKVFFSVLWSGRVPQYAQESAYLVGLGEESARLDEVLRARHGPQWSLRMSPEFIKSAKKDCEVVGDGSCEDSDANDHNLYVLAIKDEMEARMLDAMIESLKRQGLLSSEGVLMHDGILIPSRPSDAQIARVEKDILENTGFWIRLHVKE